MISQSHHSVLHHSRYIACACAAATLLTVSCSDVTMSPSSPSKVDSFGSPAGASFSALSDSAIALPVSQPRCPSVAPFDVPFVIVVRPNGVRGLRVTQLQLQFTDSTGARMPSVTLAAPVPITQFGTALEASRGDLRFPVRMGIGCGVERLGTIVVQVTTRDGNGRSGSGSVSVAVR
jgi:hypothetical protein